MANIWGKNFQFNAIKHIETSLHLPPASSKSTLRERIGPPIPPEGRTDGRLPEEKATRASSEKD